jgi:hypothetical protein
MNAVLRIELSRARLRNVMLPPPALQHEPGAGRGTSWLHSFKQQPAVGIVIDTVKSWWSKHPLRAVLNVAIDASSAVIKPIAQHNPKTLVFAAALLGAAFAYSRPWRWALKPALFAGLMPQLISRVVSTLPLEAWLSVIGSTLPGGTLPTPAQRNSP